MAKERFTSGPWRFWEHKNIIQTVTNGPRHDMWGVCIPADGGNCVNVSNRADAVLIANVPRLVWALELIKAEAGLGKGPLLDKIHDLAQNAIREATEEESAE